MSFQLSKTYFDSIFKRPFFIKRADYVINFCDLHRLWPNSGKLTVSLSGGADSLFLLLVMKRALEIKRIFKLEAIHFHHGNREDQASEADFVNELCKTLSVTLLIKKLHLNNCSNFEHLAREARYNFYKSISSKGDRIALGQQLDDSFEWSLMQQFKSSSLTPILGIPLVNEKVIRPLMCFSAMQIRYCLKFLNISYIVDPTNNETKYERNYIRHVLIPRIKNRYPSYLCHYVARSNCLAYNLGKHCKIEDDQNWIRFEDRFGGIGIYAKDLRLSFNGGGSRLTDVIRELSQSSRGSLRKQVQMMIEAQQKGKKGPMIFSGGVYGFMDKGLFYFLHSEQLRKVHELDEKLSLELRDAQIPDVCHKLDKQKWITQSVFPFLICSNDKDTSKTFGPGLKKTHFLFPKSTKVLLDRGLYFQTYTRALSYSKGRRLENNVSFYFLQSFGLQ